MKSEYIEICEANGDDIDLDELMDEVEVEDLIARRTDPNSPEFDAEWTAKLKAFCGINREEQ